VLQSKNALLKILCVSFYAIYIFRQTTLVDSFARIVEQTLIALAVSIVSLNLGQLKCAIIKSREKCIRLSLSMVIAGILFSEYGAMAISAGKVALILLFLVVVSHGNGKNILLKMADVGVLSLLILGAATCWDGGGVFSNGVWTKNSLSFLNPNIGPYFAFASLYVYFVMRAEARFWFLFFLIILSSTMFNIYSRTFLMGSVLLMVYQLFNRSGVDLKKFIRISTWVVLFTTVASIAVSVFLIVGEGAVDGEFGLINTLSSARLFFMAKNPFVVSSSGPVIMIRAFDSIYYELIFILGPYVLLRLFIWWRSVAKKDKVDLYPMEIYSILVFSFIGLFDGMIFKFSPMIIIVCSIVFTEIKDWINNSEECSGSESLEICK
jgi:hypothetical protein